MPISLPPRERKRRADRRRERLQYASRRPGREAVTPRLAGRPLGDEPRRYFDPGSVSNPSRGRHALDARGELDRSWRTERGERAREVGDGRESLRRLLPQATQ